jgi:hypothetical protein
MHAGFPYFNQGLHQVFHLGAGKSKLPDQVDMAGGPLIADGIALALKLGFGYLLRDSLLGGEQSQKAQAFFDENFVFKDTNAPGGQRYYQGKFLIRTRKPGDNMNVWLRFCPEPDKLYTDTPFGRTLNSLFIVTTGTLTEEEAARAERDPEQVDMVIRFKDIDSVVNLIGRNNVDIVGLLLENVVQLTGNVGHLFKLGAIAKNIELSLGLTKTS